MKTFTQQTYYSILRDLKKAHRELYAKLEYKEFMIHLQYKNKVGEDAISEFTIEGITNAIALFEQYRAIGHSMKLHTMVLYLDNEKYKKVNFKYKK